MVITHWCCRENKSDSLWHLTRIASAGTTITQINTSGGATTYTLYCGGANDCRINTNSSSLSNLFAFSQVVRESTVVYQVGQVSATAPFSFGRTYTDTIDAGQSDQIVLDSPYFGMARRPYVPAAGSAPMMNEAVSLRGAGWSIAIGTATLAQQLGGPVDVSSFTPLRPTIYTQCTLPGTVVTYANSSYGCNVTNRSTAKFFSVNLKY